VTAIIESKKRNEVQAATCTAEENVSGQRLFSIDFLRSYATVQVLLIHSAGIFAGVMMSKGTWWAGNLLDSSSRPAVPIFFMISGMLLLAPEKYGKDESISLFLRRRFTKVFLPLAVWSFVFISYRCLMTPSSIQWNQMPQLLSTPAYYHLGFLFELGGLYLVTPILRAFVKDQNKTVVKYLVALWFISQCLVPEIAFYFGWTPPITFQMTAGSVGVFVLGYLLRDSRFTKNQIPLALLGMIVCVTGIAVGTFVLTHSAPNKIIDERFYEYHHPLVVAYAALTFVFLRSVSFKLPPKAMQVCRKAVTSFAAASFTVYLVHPLFLEKIQTYTSKILTWNGNKFLLCTAEICITATITAITGWAFYILARKLKLPTWLVP